MLFSILAREWATINRDDTPIFLQLLNSFIEGSKTDLQPLGGISEEDMKLVVEMKAEAMKTLVGLGEDPINDDGVLFTLSNLTEEGVMAVKNAACERLLNQRVELKLKSKKMNDCLNLFHVAMPILRDQRQRPPCIPQAVLEAKAKKEVMTEKRKLESDLENQNGGAGVYSASLTKHYILANDEWKEDIMPEILNGYNVCDFYTSDISQRLEEVEWEGLVQEQDVGADVDMEGHELTQEKQDDLISIRKMKSSRIQQHRIKKSTAESRPTVPRKFDKDKKFTSGRMGRQLSALGLDPTMAINRACSRSRGRKRERSLVRGESDGHDVMDLDVGQQPNKKLRARSISHSRSRSQPPGEVVVIPGDGFKDSAQKVKALKLARKSAKKRNKDARRGEADRVIPCLKPKHLFSGKRSIGKTSRR